MPPVSIEKWPSIPSELAPIESPSSTTSTDTVVTSTHRESTSLFILDAFFEYERGNTSCLYHIYQTLAALSRRVRGSPIPSGSINVSMVETVTLWLTTLSTSHITRFNKSYKEFIDKILSIDWVVLSDAFVKSYVDFICNLVSAHPFYILPCFRMLVSSLEHRSLDDLAEDFASVSPSHLQPDMMYERVHGCLSALYRLVPASPSFLVPLFSEYYPHKKANKLAQVTFLSNLLRLAKEFPQMRASIMEIAVGRIIQVDVEIQVKVDELEDDELELVQSEALAVTDYGDKFELEEESNDARIHSPNPQRASMSLLEHEQLQQQHGHEGEDEEEMHDGNTYNSDNNEDDEDDEEGKGDACAATQEQSETIAHIKEDIDKLDAMLLLMFQFIQGLHANSQVGKESLVQFQSCFLEMLSIFEKIVLPTLKSRYTQFLMFYMSSLSESFPDNFLGILAGRLFGESSEPVLKGKTAALHSPSFSASPNPLGFDAVRLISASYIGSYVARAKFLDPSTVRTCLELLLSWCDHYIMYYAHASQLSAFSWGSSYAYKHAVFYAVAQSIFYIFCFRHAEILGSGSFAYNEKLRSSFERLVYCRLNPLMNTSPTIAKEFARISARFELVYCLHLFNGSRSRSSSLPLSRTGSPSTTTPSPPPLFSLAVPDSGRSTPLSHIAAEATELDEFDNFFPYDPYKLKSSCCFIGEELFIEWSDDASADMDVDEA